MYVHVYVIKRGGKFAWPLLELDLQKDLILCHTSSLY